MMMPSNGKIFCITGPLCGEFTGPGEFPSQRPVTRSFDVFFDLRLNKRLSKQPWGWWFEMPSWPLRRQCNAACLNHWGWVIYASVKHTIIASDNGLSPIRHQAIIWSNAAVLSNRPLETYFSEILFKFQKFSFMEMHMKMSSAKWASILSQPPCAKSQLLLQIFTHSVRQHWRQRHNIYEYQSPQ